MKKLNRHQAMATIYRIFYKLDIINFEELDTSIDGLQVLMLHDWFKGDD